MYLELSLNISRGAPKHQIALFFGKYLHIKNNGHKKSNLKRFLINFIKYLNS
jgi:hypothetical protein